ncbi:MAG: glutamate--tRNA ligase [Armatimonadota bacterium]
MEGVRVRFAPSPTGFAHIGNIRNALFDWLLVRHFGGSFILRIEDTDRARIVPGALEEIYESLRWLGALWDEGPEVGGDFGPYVQSERLHLYDKYARQLVEQGNAYYCFCTSERLAEMRKEQESKKQATGYDRCCLQLSPEEIAQKQLEGLPAVIRFKVPDEGQTPFYDLVRGDITFENKLLDDFVIMKSDGYPTYHFASIVDDHLMEITHVIRSEEWISSTPKHVLLYKSLGWDPPKWVHPPLILGPDKSKLSKRHGAVRFLDYKEKGFLPEAMINYIALLGWSPGTDQELFTLDEIIEQFNIDGIVNHPVVFDIQKLEWMNGVYIRSADTEHITDLALPYLKEAGLIPENPAPEEMEYIKSAISLEKDKLKLLTDVVERTDFFFQDEPTYEEKGMNKWLRKDYVPGLLRKLIECIESIPELTAETAEEAVRKSGEELGISGGQVVHPIRMAVTGKTAGPGLFETIALLGKNRVIFRLNRTIGEISDINVD